MIKENFDNNGYDYVDLGLPSGTLWATMNVGASNPLDYGLYFKWGDTKGYAANQAEPVLNFFCKDSGESDKEYCRFIVDFENYGIYTGTYTSFEDGDSLYNDLLNPSMKWKVIYDNPFEAGCKVLEFENGEQYVKFIGVDYNDVKDFFEANK